MSTNTKYSYDPQELIHPDCPNFKMYEIFKSNTAYRLGIDNTEGFSDTHRDWAANLVLHGLQPLRNIYGSLQPSSWYRCYELEKEICQKAFANWWRDNPTCNFDDYFERKSHPDGGTIDFEIPSLDNDVLFEHIRDCYPFDELIREYRIPGDPRSGWVHWSMQLESMHNRFSVMARP